MRASRSAATPPWWLREEIACKCCLTLHARLLEVHCAGCGARACSACVVIVGELLLCGACGRDGAGEED